MSPRERARHGARFPHHPCVTRQGRCGDKSPGCASRARAGMTRNGATTCDAPGDRLEDVWATWSNRRVMTRDEWVRAVPGMQTNAHESMRQCATSRAARASTRRARATSRNVRSRELLVVDDIDRDDAPREDNPSRFEANGQKTQLTFGRRRHGFPRPRARVPSRSRSVSTTSRTTSLVRLGRLRATRVGRWGRGERGETGGAGRATGEDAPGATRHALARGSRAMDDRWTSLAGCSRVHRYRVVHDG